MLSKKIERKKMKKILALSYAGLALTLASIALYFFWFVWNENIRDNPWMLVLSASIGTGLSAICAFWLWKQGKGVAGAFPTTLAMILLGGFLWYLYVFSYQIPKGENAIQVGEKAPPFQLMNTKGKPVTLRDLPNQWIVLVFYRGAW
ncbi:MAG: hypothetical protein D6805_10175 [Planctomycetota bacterium]|nr:MAG: hypothetical protein D6805_10175 [Planctomycetota bacterium]